MNPCYEVHLSSHWLFQVVPPQLQLQGQARLVRSLQPYSSQSQASPQPLSEHPQWAQQWHPDRQWPLLQARLVRCQHSICTPPRQHLHLAQHQLPHLPLAQLLEVHLHLA